MLLGLSNITKYFGSELLFEKVSFEIAENSKIGLVGVNGAGKTTLFKIITGEIPYDSGEMYKNKELNMGYMEQYTPTQDTATVYDETLSVFDELLRLETAIDDINLEIELGDGDIDALTLKQHELTEKYERCGGFVYKSRTKATLMGLGFSESDFLKPLSVLSGGELTRVKLAKMLLGGCNLLLLDEPTNHLDITAVTWLEEFLADFDGAVLIISHDRYFLDKVTSKTFEMDGSTLTVYNGNYSRYLQLREENIDAMEKKYTNTMREIKRIEGIVEQQRRWNRERNIKTAESKLKMIDRLEKTLEAPPDEAESIKFEFSANKTGGNDVITAENLKMKFDGRVIFDNVNLHIRRGERIFLLGPNGCGKTTLFKTLLGEYTPNSGEIRFGSDIETGYYDQSQSDLDERKTVIDEIWDKYPKKTQTEIRNACAAFLFKGEDVFKDISVLSGGEKARVSLLKLMLSGSNFLMLDEPTNHLDIASKEALENAFEGYNGTMFIVSHDRYFINKLADKIYRLTPDGIDIYEGNYDYYLEKLKTETVPQKKTGGAEDYRIKKEKEAKIRKLQNACARFEQRIEELEVLMSELEVELENPEISSDYSKIMEISNQISEYKSESDDLLMQWEEAQTELDMLISP